MRKHQRQTTNIIACLLLSLFAITSCNNNTYYHSFQPVTSTGWNRNDTLLFSLPEHQHIDSLAYTIGIRHQVSYKYRDIWLKINQDTLHLYLADSEGKWDGNGIGEFRQFTHPFHFSHSAEDSIQEFRIVHIMQDTLLNGIHDIGLQIERKP